MKRIICPPLLLGLLALACQFGGVLPNATPSAMPDTLPPTAEPATPTALPTTVATTVPTAAPTEPSATAKPGSEALRMVVRLAIIVRDLAERPHPAPPAQHRGL